MVIYLYMLVFAILAFSILMICFLFKKVILVEFESGRLFLYYVIVVRGRGEVYLFMIFFLKV